MTTINKSRLMKEANRLMKYEGYDRSLALKLAWLSERKWSKEDALMEEAAKRCAYRDAHKGSIMFDMNMLANTLHAYYNGYGYKGD